MEYLHNNMLIMNTLRIFFILFFMTITQAQWSTNPNNNLIVGYGLNPKICSDSASGCYVTYEYGTTFYPRKLGLERLDRYGYKPWGTEKQIQGELPEQWQAQIIEDGEGGVIVSYQDNNEENWPYIKTRIRVQRVDSSGNFLWEQTGVRVSLSETNQGSQRLASDGDGGTIIVWQAYDSTGILESISVNRINRFGERMWGDSGIVFTPTSTGISIIRASDGNFYVQVYPDIFRINQDGEILNQYSTTLGLSFSDPEGGVVLSTVVGNINNKRLVAQRKDSLGNNLWQEPYVEIADSLDVGTSLNILANNNYYYYGWLGRKNGVAEILQIQSLRNDGTKLFIAGSISLSDSPTSVTSIPIISSYDGSNIYAWTYWNSPQTYNANYARRIDSTGSDIWLENPVLLNEPSLGYFSMVTDCFGGAIGVGYMNSDFAIRVLKVSVNGNLGEVITNIEDDNVGLSLKENSLFQNYPNPFNSTTNIKYKIDNDSRVKISVYNILGEKIKTLIDEYKNAGTYSLGFNSNDLPSGVYIYTMQTNNNVLTKKLTIIR